MMDSATTVLFESQWCTLLSKPAPDGKPYYMVKVSDYVAVVAITPDRELVLVKQFRPVVDRDTFELPSGHIEDGEKPEQAAARELLEETGMAAPRLELLGVLVPDVGRLVNRMWCYWAADVVEVAVPLDSEGISVSRVSEDEFMKMASDGRIDHALNLAVVFLAVAKGKLAT